MTTAGATTSVPKPPIQHVGTRGNNLWAGQGQAQKLAIVCHIMEGSLGGCDEWFANPAAQASANYGVGVDGTIHCYVDPQGNDAPFANGLLQNPDAAVQALQGRNAANPNYWTISIEHEGHSGDALTPAQFHASTWLAAWLCSVFGIPADDNHLLGHYEFDNVTRSGCPGWNHDMWQRWEAAVASMLAEGPVPTQDPRVAAALAALPGLKLAVAQVEHALTAPASETPEAFTPGAPGS